MYSYKTKAILCFNFHLNLSWSERKFGITFTLYFESQLLVNNYSVISFYKLRFSEVKVIVVTLFAYKRSYLLYFLLDVIFLYCSALIDAQNCNDLQEITLNVGYFDLLPIHSLVLFFFFFLTFFLTDYKLISSFIFESCF